MYEAFYGLDEKPFAIPPDPAYLFLSEKHQNALSRLQYSIMNEAAFTVITGEIGSGKTTLVRELIHDLDENEISVGLVANVNFTTFKELMQWILYAFNLDYDGKEKIGLFDVFTKFVIDNYANNRKTLLIIDEAQNLNTEILEQLRMLSNINVDQHQVLQLILVGQPGLMDMLKRPELEQFSQRIEVEFFLQALNLAETTEYIKHRLKVAGASENLFLPETFPIIWRNTNGVPRLINALCGMALVYGFADFKDFIDSDVINHVLSDKKSGSSSLSEGSGHLADLSALSSNPKFINNVRPVLSNSIDSAEKRIVKEQTDLSTIEKLFFKEGD